MLDAHTSAAPPEPLCPPATGAFAQMSRRSLRALTRVGARCSEMLRMMGVDVVYVSAILILSYRLFLDRWTMWEDQSIYEYMAWGVRHGRVLYRDVITMNWPGNAIIDVVAQAISGMDPRGPR